MRITQLSVEPKAKCDHCDRKNRECLRILHLVKDYMGVQIHICQKCISQMFLQFKKDR